MPFAGQFQIVISVANLEVDEEARGQQRMARLLDALEQHAADARMHGVVAERVLHAWMAAWLQQRGYAPLPADPDSMFKAVAGPPPA